jgi:hypothetical protein
MDYAKHQPLVTAEDVAEKLGMKLSTARQLLSRLSSCGRLSRIGYGQYAEIHDKDVFPINVPQAVKDLYNELKAELPFTDFCLYDGGLLDPLQHHLSVNHSIYVETNRDAVDAVFALLKNRHSNVYRQPDAAFIGDYVDLTAGNIIIKPLVTESPILFVDKVPSPMLEKLLVDLLKDSDFEYLHGREYDYIFENATDQYRISTTRLIRYARRRGIAETIKTKLNKIKL